MALSELWHSTGEALSVLFAGLLTGIAVTHLLAWPLYHSGRRSALLIGAASLPLGAFLFGIIASWVHFGLVQWPGVEYCFARDRFDPLQVGLDYATGASVSWLAVMSLPVAVVTTILLHRRLHGMGDFHGV
jgi:hypothetical protein